MQDKLKNTPWINKLSGLMRTLTQSQRRDFKKYIKFWGGKNKHERKYVLLFDAVHKFQHSGKEEKRLTAHLLKLKKFGQTPRDVAVSAQYLYRKILESMRTTPVSPHLNQLHARSQDIIFLYNKNLFEDCRELIGKAYSLTRDLDKPALALELNFWKHRLPGWTEKYHTPDSIAEWSKSQRQLLSEVKEEVEYNVLRTEMRIFTQNKEELPASFDDTIQALLAEHEKGLTDRLTLRCRIYLYSTFSDYYDLKYALSKGKTPDGLVKKALMKRSMHFKGLVIEAYRSNKVFAEEEQLSYVNVMDAYLNRCLRNGRADLAERLEADLAREKNELLEYRTIVYYRLQRYLALDQFWQAREYFEKNDVAAGIEKYKYRIPEIRVLALRYTIGQIYYALNDFDHAGDWFGQVARMKVEARPDVVLVSKVLEIICLWEYGAYKNDPDLARPVKNLRRSLRRTKWMNPFLEKILQAVEMVLRYKLALTKAGFPVLLADLKKDYVEDKAKIHFYLVLAWFDARLNRTPLSKELIKYEQ